MLLSKPLITTVARLAAISPPPLCPTCGILHTGLACPYCDAEPS